MARILIADDDAALRSFAERALTADGHQVTGADDGLSALARLEAGVYDLLVSDLDMPGLDGFALFQRISGAAPELKVLIISGHTEELSRARGLPADRVATLAKPFTLQQIKDAVRQLLAR